MASREQNAKHAKNVREHFAPANRCQRCHNQDWWGVKRQSRRLNPKRRATIGILLKGGITSRCQIATAVGVGHHSFRLKGETWGDKSAPIIHPITERIDRKFLESWSWHPCDSAAQFPLVNDNIRCEHCRGRLRGVPCWICTVEQMLACRYSWAPTRQAVDPDIGGIKELHHPR